MIGNRFSGWIEIRIAYRTKCMFVIAFCKVPNPTGSIDIKLGKEKSKYIIKKDIDYNLKSSTKLVKDLINSKYIIIKLSFNILYSG